MKKRSTFRRPLIIISALASAIIVIVASIALQAWLESRNVPVETMTPEGEKIAILRALAGTTTLSEDEKRAALDSLSNETNRPSLPEKDRLEILKSLQRTP